MRIHRSGACLFFTAALALTACSDGQSPSRPDEHTTTALGDAAWFAAECPAKIAFEGGGTLMEDSGALDELPEFSDRDEWSTQTFDEYVSIFTTAAQEARDGFTWEDWVHHEPDPSGGVLVGGEMLGEPTGMNIIAGPVVAPVAKSNPLSVDGKYRLYEYDEATTVATPVAVLEPGAGEVCLRVESGAAGGHVADSDVLPHASDAPDFELIEVTTPDHPEGIYTDLGIVLDRGEYVPWSVMEDPEQVAELIRSESGATTQPIYSVTYERDGSQPRTTGHEEWGHAAGEDDVIEPEKQDLATLDVELVNPEEGPLDIVFSAIETGFPV